MRKRKRTYYAAALAAVMMAGMQTAIPLKGQVTPATAFYWENPLVINPAAIRTEAMVHFSLSARKQ